MKSFFLVILCSLSLQAAVTADYFTRTDGSGLGASWTTLSGSFEMQTQAVYSTSASRSVAYHTGTTGLGTDVVVQITARALSGTQGCNNYRGVAARLNISTDTYYSLQICDPGGTGNKVIVRRWVSGSPTTIIDPATNSYPSEGNNIRMVITGTNPVHFDIYHYNAAGTQQGSTVTYDDSDASRIQAAGAAGIVGIVSSTGMKVDNFYAAEASDSFPTGWSLATESYVSATATHGGDGTKANPYRLDAILSNCTAFSGAGKTVWILPGTYTPNRADYGPPVADGGWWLFCTDGASGNPMVWRAYPSTQTVYFDPNSACDTILPQFLIHVTGDHNSFYGFHATNSVSCKSNAGCGSNPSPNTIRSVKSTGVDNNFYLISAYDTGEGPTTEYSSTGGGFQSGIILRNGWSGPDRYHGHAIYIQNDGTAWKEFNRNVIAFNAGAGLRIYTTAQTNSKINMLDNTSWGKGEFATLLQTSEMYDINVKRNYIYQSLFSWATDSIVNHVQNIAIEDNVMDGPVNIRWLESATFQNNTVSSTTNTSSGCFLLGATKDGGGSWRSFSAASVTIDNNLYHRCNDNNSFSKNDLAAGEGTNPKTFALWKSDTGADAASTEQTSTAPATGGTTVGAPTYSSVVAIPEEPGRGIVRIFNWSEGNTVDVDVSSVLNVGDPYAIYDAQEWPGTPVATGTYAGGNLTFDMTLAGFTDPNIDNTFSYPYSCPAGSDSGQGAYPEWTISPSTVCTSGTCVVTTAGTHYIAVNEVGTITGYTSETALNNIWTATAQTPTTWTFNSAEHVPGGIGDGTYSDGTAKSRRGVASGPGALSFHVRTNKQFGVYIIRRQQTTRTVTRSIYNSHSAATKAKVEYGMIQSQIDFPTQTVSCAYQATCTWTLDNEFLGPMWHRETWLDGSDNVIARSDIQKLVVQ